MWSCFLAPKAENGINMEWLSEPKAETFKNMKWLSNTQGRNLQKYGKGV
jgi:hypothetical protein